MGSRRCGEGTYVEVFTTLFPQVLLDTNQISPIKTEVVFIYRDMYVISPLPLYNIPFPKWRILQGVFWA